MEAQQTDSARPTTNAALLALERLHFDQMLADKRRQRDHEYRGIAASAILNMGASFLTMAVFAPTAELSASALKAWTDSFIEATDVLVNGLDREANRYFKTTDHVR